MPTTRSKQELEALRAEAEKRVRLGESRAQTARSLDVSPQTLAGWATRYGWRKMDIEAEQDGVLQTKADALVAKLNAQEAAAKAQAEQFTSLTRQITEAAELRLAAARAEGAEAREKFEAALAAMERVLDEVGPPRPGVDVEEVAGGDGDAEEAEEEDVDVTSEVSTLKSMKTARGYLEAAERAARVAWRLRATADKLEVRQERLRLLFEEKLVAAAEARRKAVVPGFYPDRDPANYEEKTEACMKSILRVAYLERRAPADVEMGHSKCMGFRWPGADGPWFKRDCMAGTFNDDPAPPVRRFEEAHPDAGTRELTVQEKAEVAYLKGLLWRWGSECDPFNREWRIADAQQQGRSEYMSLRRNWPEMWKGLVLEGEEWSGEAG
jgi:hypothetical protein